MLWLLQRALRSLPLRAPVGPVSRIACSACKASHNTEKKYRACLARSSKPARAVAHSLEEESRKFTGLSIHFRQGLDHADALGGTDA